MLASYVRNWHHPEMPESANYFRLLVRCGPKQTFGLTGPCQCDILHSVLAGGLPNAI